MPFQEYLNWVVNNKTLLHARPEFISTNDDSTPPPKTGRLEAFYLDTDLAELSAALHSDIRTPLWYSTAPINTVFWFGVQGTSSGLHYDDTPNCNVQVKGKKEFVLFPPSDSRFLYRTGPGTHCDYDPNHLDSIRFPKSGKATAWRCTLHPREAIYIPPGWFHQVTVRSSWAINVNFFWKRRFPQGLKNPSMWRLLLSKHLLS